jgi:hypothetical protein
MSGPFETYLNECFDEGRFVKLERDVEGILGCISSAGITRISFIEGKVSKLEKDYSKMVQELGHLFKWRAMKTFHGFSVYCSLKEFEELTRENWRGLRPKEREERAYEIMAEYGFFDFSPENLPDDIIFNHSNY